MGAVVRAGFSLCCAQEIKSYPVQWIKLVEKLDEGAFHRKHMFQVVIIPSGPRAMEDDMGQVTLYLQAGVSPGGETLQLAVGLYRANSRRGSCVMPLRFCSFSGRERAEPLGVCHQEGMSVEQRHAPCLPSWCLQEEQVDVLQNRFQPRYGTAPPGHMTAM